MAGFFARTLNMSRPVPSYAYDPKHGIAFKATGQDSGVERTLRFAAAPPIHVQTADWSEMHTTSGARLGMSAAALVRMFGKPFVVRGCGLERYTYATGQLTNEDALEFTIYRGRVVEIFQASDG
ncbi:MAG: hypothetical protein DLM50_04835 [Candidatus Meridianibacter frigidus]|nr:MAG: hypothetical protein DLM50_04835 [Candidatus Eremiobacteraeota bacterium]